MNATRLDDWRLLLSEAIRARRDTPFVWGSHDCGLTAAALLAAISGRDIAAPIRGRYSTEFGALRAIVRTGAKSVEDFLVRAGLVRVPRAVEGDLALVRRPPLDVLMLADGRGSAWAQDARGLVLVKLPPTAIFWRL